MRHWLKKWLPSHEKIRREKHFRWLNRFLHNPDFWHLHRHAVAKGVAAGLFINVMPVPFQMLLAAIVALFFRGNILIAALITWISNPLTFIPINYFIYKVGAFFVDGNTPPSQLPAWEWSKGTTLEHFHQVFLWFQSLGKAYFVGLPIVAVGIATLGYMSVHIIWRISVISRRRRKHVKK